MLMLETVVLFYTNAIFTILTVIPTHTLSLVKVPRVLYKNTSYRAYIEPNCSKILLKI